VYHLAEKKVVQLGDPTLRDVTTTSDDGLWAIGTDERAYGPILEYDEQYYDYYLVNTMTGERRMILQKHNGPLTMSPDAKYALYFADKSWWTVSLADGKGTKVAGYWATNFWREDFDAPGAPPPYGSAGWTKDGKYILLYDQFDIWRVTPNGLEAVNLTQGAGRNTHTEFRYVRFGNDPRDPDGRWIDSAQPLLLKATDSETFDTGFYRTRVDATAAPQKLTFTAKSLSNPVKARDADVVVLTAQTFEEFPDLLITDSSFAKMQKVTNTNPQQAQVNWGTAELVHFRNTDGVALKGTLYKPENFDPKKKYPMIVYIYEKLSQNVHAYVAPAPRHTINPTFYASNGYLILEPDIVYTIGQPGQSALKCVLPAIDAMVARGFVDEKNIGIEGHSWGGYQIAYMITQTDRFKAVEAGAPVANMTSAYDGIRWGPGLPRQFQYERSQSRIGATLWAAPLKFVENSPIFMADRVKTPLLILQNDADTAVPWYQGIEYYLALRRLGKEVYMFSYNGEPHGITRRPDAKDFTVRMQQYFDYFLKGAPKPEWMVKGIPFLDKDTEKERFKQSTGVY
jgi:dienelactone hydrolase